MMVIAALKQTDDTRDHEDDNEDHDSDRTDWFE